MAVQTQKVRTFPLPKPLVFSHCLEYLKSSGKFCKGDQVPASRDSLNGLAWPIR